MTPRQLAKQFGFKTYQDNPCKHGHGVVRYTSTGKCVACMKARTANYRAENPEKAKAASAKWRAANIEKEKARGAQYRAANVEKIKARNAKWAAVNVEKEKARKAKWVEDNPEYQAKWAAANVDKIKAYKAKYHKDNPEYQAKYHKDNQDKIAAINAKWRAANPDKLNANAARRRAAKLLRTPVWADHSKIAEFYAHAAFLGAHVDHIIPLRGRKVSGLHVHENLQLLTPSENFSKSNKYD